MNKELQLIVKLVACQFKFEPASLAAFVEIESGGIIDRFKNTKKK